MAKTRKRSPHPGVILIRPRGRYTSWRARYADPDSGKDVYERLEPVELRTDAARRDWAIRKAKALAKRRLELEDGAARKSGTPVGEGIDAFFTARVGLRDLTIVTYRACTDPFEAWCAANGVKTLDQVTKVRLLEFRDSVLAAKSGDKLRSAHTNNRILRGCSTVLRWLLERGKLPACSSDDLKLGLKRVRASIDRVEFLGRGEPAALLRAAIAHDQKTYAATRAEHRGDREPGTTPRYEPVSPFILTLLLTGLRFTEALELRWHQVDVDAPGNDGQPSGELWLRAADVKTHKAREVAFDVSPTLRDLLTELDKQRTGERVFSGLTRPTLEAARKRLKADGAPSYNWQTLRRTTGSYLTNSAGIYGAAAAFHSARRLGHSIAVAEKHYLGTVKGIPREARTLEQAMGIEGEAAAVVELVRERQASQAQAAE